MININVLLWTEATSGNEVIKECSGGRSSGAGAGAIKKASKFHPEFCLKAGGAQFRSGPGEAENHGKMQMLTDDLSVAS